MVKRPFSRRSLKDRTFTLPNEKRVQKRNLNGFTLSIEPRSYRVIKDRRTDGQTFLYI